MEALFPVDHVAFPTRSTKKTYDFYDGVLGWDLVAAFGDAAADPPWFITAYATEGFAIEFEEQVGVEFERPPRGWPFPHIGLRVESEEAKRSWKEHLDEVGVPNMELGDSTWFSDPNGVKFQVFVARERAPREEAIAAAAASLEGWLSR